MVFVNDAKLRRAQRILDLIKGKELSRTQGDEENISKFSRYMAEGKVAKEKELEYVYQKLGGLVRTEEEQAKAEIRKKEIKARGKKKMID